MIKKLPFYLGLLALVALTSHCNSTKANQEKIEKAIPTEEIKMDSPSQSVSSFNDPEKNYANFCASCHGVEMVAFVDRKWKKGNTKADLINSIKYGIGRSGMPAYDTTFTDKEIEELSEYILTGIKDRKTYDSKKRAVTPKLYATQHLYVSIDTVVDKIQIPWGLKVTKDGTIFFTEKKGTFKIRKPNGRIVEIKNVPEVKSMIQGGMLDIALHPSYETNGFIYLSYSKKHPTKLGQSTTAVVRGKLKGDVFDDQVEIFEAHPYSKKGYHFGSRMVFDNEGFLYITVGDRGSRDENPQSLSSSCGKVHRVYDDGRIPEDNPFYNTEGAVKSIWTYGNRNAQGLIYDEVNDIVWEHEHGPRGGDELNHVVKGANYGWPLVSYGINYNGTTFTDKAKGEGFKDPINYWIPSIGPSGMAIVKGNNYGAWKGDILSGSLRFNYVSRIKLNGTEIIEEEKILQDIGRVRSIEMGANGALYVGVESPGRILKLSVIPSVPGID